MMAAVHPLATQEPDAAASSGGNGGSGRDGLVNHRLNELERRVGRLEDSISEVQKLCIKINGKIDNIDGKIDNKVDSMMSSLAPKTYVLGAILSMIVLAFFTLFGHVLVRWLTT